MKSSLRIVNVEDSKEDAELTQAMLSARWPECQLVRVDNRQDFINALEMNSLDLILCDYTLPSFDGRQALGIAREKRPDVPFIYVSGTIGEDTAIEALKNGATDYVLKHRLMRLIPAVDRALREAQERADCQWAEETMRQSEYKYRELFESLNDAAFLVDEASGKIIDANRRAETLLGRGRSEILGCKQSRFITQDKESSQSETLEVPKDHFGTRRCGMTRADGVSLFVEVRDSPLMLYDRPLRLRLCRELTEHCPA